MKNLVRLFAFLFIVSLAASACNKKGMGCPDAFKVVETTLPALNCIK